MSAAMADYQIYHNPRCRKSRETLQILEDKGIEPQVILYLDDVPSAAELRHLGELMGKRPQDFIRTGETAYKEMIKGKDLDDESLYDLMAKHPILIERPIVVKDGKQAVLGRPPENVLELL